MFTGLIEEVGKISNIQKNFNSLVLEVSAVKILEDLKTGDSVCVNGVCTTVTKIASTSFGVDISAQTLKVTTFKNIKTDDFVNLERALKLSDRFGGHIVTGHIDCIGEFCNKNEDDNSVFLTFKIPVAKIKYFVDKGSLTIDGISLTIANIKDNFVTVCVIPHTLKNTNLKYLIEGQNVNIETDIIAKYIENFVRSNDNNNRITEVFLKENGF